MATILTKKKDTSGAPSAGDLTNDTGGAELAVNTADKRLYTKDSGGNVVEVGTNPSTINIDAGSIDGTPIGANSASTGSFTTLNTSGAVVFNDAGANVDFRVEGDTEANLLFVDASTDRVGVGTSAPSGKLDVSWGDIALTLGADSGASSTRTNNANKTARIGAVHYTNAEEPTALLVATNSSTANTLLFGGGTGSFNAATAIQFYTAANNTTTTGTERMRIDSSGNLLFNSGYGSVAPAYGCRAWVNFNGTGTIAIRASGNVSSLTDIGTGNYTVNFTSAMPDANYSVQVCGDALVNNDAYNKTTGSSNTTSGANVNHFESGGTLTDTTHIHVAIFR